MGLLDNILAKKKTAVGLDIGGSSVKVVQMAKAGDGFRLTQFGVQPVGTKFNEEGSSIGTDREAVVEAIRQLIKSRKISTKYVISSVSGESVIVRIIRMPFIDSSKRADLEFAVRNEARDFIPFEMDDVVFDYQRLGDVTVDGQKSMEVLIVAVKKELIQDHINLLNEAGLEPIIIDVGSFALVNALIAAKSVDKSEAVALVNIGADVTSIAVMRDSMTRFTRDFSTAGRNITNALVSDLGLPWNDAEELKLRYGIILEGEASRSAANAAPEDTSSSLQMVQDLSRAIDEIAGASNAAVSGQDEQASRISEICKQVVSDIASEVKRSLLYYENQLDGESVSRIILSGGTANMRNIAAYFEHLLDIPTETCRVLEKFPGHESGEGVGSESPMFGVGVGLALRNVI